MNRYIYNTDIPGKWHIVDEPKVGTYNAPTLCGWTFPYPSRKTTFRHPKQERNDYPDCQECVDNCQECKDK